MENTTILNEDNAIVNQAQLLGAIDKILVKRSIAKRVSDEQKMKGPVGIISGAQFDRVTKNLKIAKADIEAETIKIRTEFSVEALQDLQGIYNEGFYDLLAHYLIDDLVYQLDEKFLTMVKNRASTKDDLVFTQADNGKWLSSIGQSISVTVLKGLCDLPISDNRSQLGWAVVSSNIAALLGGTLNDDNTEGLDDESPSYLGRIAGVEYYIDYTHPNDGVDSVVFGIKGNGFSKGSTIYSPYKQSWIETTNAENGEPIFFLMDRTAMEINPLDKKYYNAGAGVSGFLGKFNVDLTDLDVFN